MNVYEIHEIGGLISDNPYVGRGLILGKTPNGRAAAAYFIMGRSANSRNRVFTEKGDDVFTEPFDETKCQDPSLIIYRAVARVRNHLIVTNGNQTDTIAEGLENGLSFAEALKSREFEPDAPNYTPRISGMLTFENGGFSYEMSILKSADDKGTACARFHFEYPALPGLGHFLHTYVTDGSPIPSFQGEPERIAVPEDIDEFTKAVWDALNEANKISLFVAFIDPASGEKESRLINKYN